MTVANVIPELWRARLINALQGELVWARLTTDLSGEFSGAGKTLHLNEIMADVTVRDYTRNEDIAAPQLLDDEDYEFTLSQEKYFNIAVDDVDRVQARPALMDNFSRQAARSVAEVIDTYIRGVYETGFPAGQSTVAPDAVPKDANPAKWTEAQAKAFAEFLLEQSGEMDKQHWGDQRWCVIPVDVKTGLLRYLLGGLGGAGTGRSADNVWASAKLSDFLGFSVSIDPYMPAPDAAAGNAYANFGTNEAIMWASQIRKLEAYRPEKRFADAIKGLYVYHAQRHPHAVRSRRIVRAA